MEDPLHSHFIAVIGGFAAFVSLVMITLGLFQPSSNARKFALVSFAILEALNISTQFRLPVHGEDNPPKSLTEKPMPILLALMTVALLGAGLSKTDAQRRAEVRRKQAAKSKAVLYAKHARTKVTKGD